MGDLHAKAAADPDWVPINIRQVLVVFDRFDVPYTVTKTPGSITVEVSIDDRTMTLKGYGKNFRYAKFRLSEGGEPVETRGLEDAIRKLFGGSMPSSDARPTVRATSDAARTNSVEVRRTTVIRV